MKKLMYREDVMEYVRTAATDVINLILATEGNEPNIVGELKGVMHLFNAIKIMADEEETEE